MPESLPTAYFVCSLGLFPPRPGWVHFVVLHSISSGGGIEGCVFVYWATRAGSRATRAYSDQSHGARARYLVPSLWWLSPRGERGAQRTSDERRTSRVLAAARQQAFRRRPAAAFRRSIRGAAVTKGKHACRTRAEPTFAGGGNQTIPDLPSTGEPRARPLWRGNCHTFSVMILAGVQGTCPRSARRRGSTPSSWFLFCLSRTAFR